MSNKNKLLVVCLTRMRLSRCFEMLNSFLDTRTKKRSEVIFAIDFDDPCYPKYIDMFNRFKVKYHIGLTKNTTNRINSIFNMFSKYGYYSVTNDDFVYQTKGWDEILMERAGISYGNDLLGGAALPTTSVINGDIVRALGWLQMPKLQCLCGDSVWKYIGEQLGCLRYHRDVIIEHKHFLSRKVDIDLIYKLTNARDQIISDNNIFRKWIREESESDIEKIRKVIQ